MVYAYSDHAMKRMKQRGITELELQHVFLHHKEVGRTHSNRTEIIGSVNNRLIKIIYVKKERYLKIITVI